MTIRNTLYLTPPVSRPPGRVLYSTARVSGKRKERQIAQKFFWKAGRERSAVPPPPRRLETAIMLSMESMIAMVPGSKKSPSRHRQPGEAISQQLWPRYWQWPGSNALRIWLSRINRHHSDRLAGPLTPFRRRDKPGSRCPVIQFECIISQDMTYCNGETSVIRPDLTSPGAYLILFLGESLISQPSGEVHTPV